MSKIITFSLIFLLLQGCSTYWYQPGDYVRLSVDEKFGIVIAKDSRGLFVIPEEQIGQDTVKATYYKIQKLKHLNTY